MEFLLSAKGVDEDSLDNTYEAVQSFVEREIIIEEEDDDLEGIAELIGANDKDTSDEEESELVNDETTANEEEE